jgi:hypothetical protein
MSLLDSTLPDGPTRNVIQCNTKFSSLKQLHIRGQWEWGDSQDTLHILFSINAEVTIYTSPSMSIGI